MFGPPEAVPAHESLCSRCGAEFVVPIARTRLERRPWRLVWRCRLCKELSQRRLTRNDAAVVAEWFDTAHGSQISEREVAALQLLDADAFDALARQTLFRN